MKTLEVETRLMYYFEFVRNMIVPAVTNSGTLRFEADLLILSPAGYATAVEIKVSKADLRKDLQKNHIKRIGERLEHSGKDAFKWYYEPLKFFYYAVPKKLEQAALEQIPDFCGLLVLNDNGRYIEVNKVREPRQLFKTKWTEREIFNVLRVGVMRIPGLKSNTISLQNSLKHYQKNAKK